MKKNIICLFAFLLLAGCANKDENQISSEKLVKYESYYETVLEADKFQSGSRYFDIYAEFHKNESGKMIYYVYIDNAQIAMYDIEVIVVENLEPYQLVEMVPTKGIFEDTKFSMIPYQYNVDAGYVKGFAISGDSDKEEVQLNVMVTWKDSTRLTTTREFFEFDNLDASVLGDHESGIQTGQIVDPDDLDEEGNLINQDQ